MRRGAGDTPARLKGALPFAKNAPQALRLLKPRVSSMIARPMRTAATTSILMLRSPAPVDRSVKLKAKTRTAMPSTIMKTGRQPTRVPRVPPTRKALMPDRARAEPSEPIAVACWSPR
jgi:hypothetical protein